MHRGRWKEQSEKVLEQEQTRSPPRQHQCPVGRGIRSQRPEQGLAFHSWYSGIYFGLNEKLLWKPLSWKISMPLGGL